MVRALITRNRLKQLCPSPQDLARASLHAIPVEVLALAFSEFVLMSIYAAALWYVLSQN